MIENYTRVRLRTDRFRDEGVGCGALGYVIEVYDYGAYEVEFSDSNGMTLAQVVAREEELEPNEPPVALPKNVNSAQEEVADVRYRRAAHT